MDYQYLKLNDPRISEVICLFDSGMGLGGTSSLSLKDSLRAKAESMVLACLDKDKLIGAIEAVSIDNDEVRIRNIVVTEPFRGKGIGSELLKKAELRIVRDYRPKYIKTIPMPYSFALFSKFGYFPDETHEYDWVKNVNS